MRECCRYHLPKPDEDFPKNKRNRDGLNSECKACSKVKASECRVRRRWKVLEHYGRGDVRCTCCRDATLEFLTVDHIDGGGKRHRAEVGDVYSWAVMNGFPDGLRVLCMNCNWSLGVYGYCPHDGGSKMKPAAIKVDTGRLSKSEVDAILCTLSTNTVSATARIHMVSRPTVRRIRRNCGSPA
jgi:hypothetical protein